MSHPEMCNQRIKSSRTRRCWKRDPGEGGITLQVTNLRRQARKTGPVRRYRFAADRF